MYWSVLALTTIGDLPMPRTKSEYAFLIMQLVFGLFLFASESSELNFSKNTFGIKWKLFDQIAVLGHVANIVTNVSAARKEFQGNFHFR